MPMKTQVIVEVSGGVVTNVYIRHMSHVGHPRAWYETIVVDYDDIKQGGEPPTPKTLLYMTKQYSIL